MIESERRPGLSSGKLEQFCSMENASTYSASNFEKLVIVITESFFGLDAKKMANSYGRFRLLWPCIMNVGWRERNQQDATNLMFIIKLLSQHVSGIIMSIIRRTRVFTLHSAHSLRPSSTQPQPSLPVQNTICGSAHSCSPDDGHNDARNMLR